MTKLYFVSSKQSAPAT